MTTEDILYELAGRGRAPKGELKEEMFRLHNSLMGKSSYIKREENPKTSCGSCIQRVLKNVFLWYHYDPTAPKYDSIYFTGKYGLNNTPIYKRK